MANKRAGVMNLKELNKELDKLEKASEKVLNNTIKDFRTTAPIWVAEEVIKQYNIARTEVKPKKKGERKLKTGFTTFKGKTIGTMAVVYKGRPLTPTRFLKATKRQSGHPGTGSATVQATIKVGGKSIRSKSKKITKKQRQNIGRNFKRQGTRQSPRSPIMMLHTGNKKESGTNYIPFQRKSQKRNDLEPIKTVSMPQMVSNKVVREHIDRQIDAKLGKQFDKHLKHFLPAEKK